ncbi:MAG: hypothetical protein JWM28_130 [Chitinophagaceae bacterium]|nr:hypothetical protein [Chitinophagaceae bacterium]
MKVRFLPGIYMALNCILFPFTVKPQSAVDSSASSWHQVSSKKGLFESDQPLDITLKGNLRDLLNDRSGEPKNYPLFLSYGNEDSSEISIPVNIKTRGHFRRVKGNCVYPPLLIQFPGNDSPVATTFFDGLVKLKLVMPCRGDEFVVREWLVYKLYNLVAPESFRARLTRIKLIDEKNKKEPSPFYGILLEEEKQMAKRNNTVPVNRKIKPEQTIAETFLRMAVFEYLIGNTDWSVQYLQNVKLIAPDSTAVPITVPYDFDHAGIVGAPYALPAEELLMSSTRERRYRGYCIQDMTIFDSTIAIYNRLKKDIYNLYASCSLLDAKYIKATLQYLDEFYTIINNPKALQKEFGYPCTKYGTGNVIIKGLKED